MRARSSLAQAPEDLFDNGDGRRLRPKRRVPAIVIGLAGMLLLCGCNDTHPLYGPNTPRNGAGTPIDPIYGTPIPGAPQGNAGL